MSDTKRCPACAEEVQAAARICRYCQYNFESATVAPSPVPPPPIATVASETNGLAIASLVLGIVWLGGLGSLLAIIFGHRGKQQIDRSNGRQSGRGMAVAGLILGYIGAAFIVLAIGVSIAVPVFLNQRAKGDTARLESTLKNAATAMESRATMNNGRYSGTTAGDLAAEGLLVPAGLTVTIPYVDDDEYCIEATDGSQTMHFSTDSFTPVDGSCP